MVSIGQEIFTDEERSWFKWDSPWSKWQRLQVLQDNFRKLFWDAWRFDKKKQKKVLRTGIPKDLGNVVRQNFINFQLWSSLWDNQYKTGTSTDFPDQLRTQFKIYNALQSAVLTAMRGKKRTVKSLPAKVIATAGPKTLSDMTKSLGAFGESLVYFIAAGGLLLLVLSRR